LIKLICAKHPKYELAALSELTRRALDQSLHEEIYLEGGITNLVDLLSADDTANESKLEILRALTNLACNGKL
jgi:hypothetical protein